MAILTFILMRSSNKPGDYLFCAESNLVFLVLRIILRAAEYFAYCRSRGRTQMCSGFCLISFTITAYSPTYHD